MGRHDHANVGKVGSVVKAIDFRNDRSFPAKTWALDGDPRVDRRLIVAALFIGYVVISLS